MKQNIVAKFGGTSVATPDSIDNVTKIISENKYIKFVVISAVSGVTNLLVQLCQSAPNIRSSIVAKILDIHLELAKKLNLELESQIIQVIKILEQTLDITSLNPQLTDYIVSLGEDLSCLIITEYLNKQGIKARHLDAREFLITDDTYGNAIPNLDKIKSYKFPKELCITQGFIGATLNRNTTTLGRGGSDYSAALIAEAIKASELLIYTDVPGVCTIDPKICQQAILIPKLNFQEVARMSHLGAKILHPKTIEPCIRSKIPIQIMSTFAPDKAGTYISFDNNDDHIRSILIRQHQMLITIKDLKILNSYNFLLNTFNIFIKHKVEVDFINTTDFSDLNISFIVNILNTSTSKLNSFIQNKELSDELQQFAQVSIEENLTLLSVIDNRLTITNSIQNIISKIDTYKIRFVYYGTSDSMINILLSDDHVVDVAKILHNHLLEKNSCNI